MPKILKKIKIPDGDYCVNHDQDVECKFLKGTDFNHNVPLSESYLECPVFNVADFKVVQVNDEERAEKCDACKSACDKADKEKNEHHTIK